MNGEIFAARKAVGWKTKLHPGFSDVGRTRLQADGREVAAVSPGK